MIRDRLSIPRPKTIHQFLTGATQGDAITAHAFDIRRWLREMGVRSDIYAQYIDASVQDEVHPYTGFRPNRREELVIYHHSIGSDVADFLLDHGRRLILIHHNTTPPEFFTGIDHTWTQMADLGERQLASLRPNTELALADSAYNEKQLLEAGYGNTGVLPITLVEDEYRMPVNTSLAQQLSQIGPILLFVSRLAPNKKQEDLVKLLYYYRRIRSTAQLVLVGDRWTVGYDRWVESLAADLGLDDAVTLTGKVSQQDLITYYRTADLYVSMSEHEGFGKPLIESMYLDLPILAYGTSGVPETMGNAGVLFHEKDYERLAEVVDILISNQALRQRIMARQRQRVESFLERHVREVFEVYLTQMSPSRRSD